MNDEHRFSEFELHRYKGISGRRLDVRWNASSKCECGTRLSASHFQTAAKAEEQLHRLERNHLEKP